MSKAIVIYYSYSGNTQRVAEILKEELSAVGECQTLAINTLDESNSFLGQCWRAMRKKKAKIDEDTKVDLNGYDLIAFGTPVWAFGMAPGLRTYLDKCSGLKGKKVITFATYGSGAGKDKCVNEIVAIAQQKGAKEVKTFFTQMFDVKKKDLVVKQIREII